MPLIKKIAPENKPEIAAATPSLSAAYGAQKHNRKKPASLDNPKSKVSADIEPRAGLVEAIFAKRKGKMLADGGLVAEEEPADDLEEDKKETYDDVELDDESADDHADMKDIVSKIRAKMKFKKV